MKTTQKDITDSAEEFWEGIYQKSSPKSRAQPGEIVERFVKDLPVGRALELGCAKGDDAVWLAKQGWHVTAVDVSSTVLGYASANASQSGVTDKISFEQHDLTMSFPDGLFDLVLASFFYSPTPLERAKVLGLAAERVVSGGRILIINHGSRAPWSWASPDAHFPTAQEMYESLGLEENEWSKQYVEDVERLAKGPNGEEATVIDSVIFLRRK